MKRFIGVLVMLCAVSLASARTAGADEFVVTNTTDTDGACAPSPVPGADPPVGAGDCSLRQAINAANANPGPDIIRFNISTLDPNFNGTWWTIKLGPLGLEGTGVGLPMLDGPDGSGTTIDGFSQPPPPGEPLGAGPCADRGLGTVPCITSERPGVLDSGNSCTVLTFRQPYVAIDANKAFAPAPTTPSAFNGDVMSIAGDASAILIKGLSIYDGFGNPGTSDGIAVAAHAGPGTNRVVEAMFIGVLPDGSAPGLIERNFGFGVQQNSVRGAPPMSGGLPGKLTVTGSYVGFNGLTGINGQDNLSTIIATSNEVFQNGGKAATQDGFDINGVDGLVECNLSHDNTSTASNGGSGAGLEIGSQSSGQPLLDSNIVRYNSFFGNMNSGISIRRGADGNLIEKNVITDNLVGISVNIESRIPTNRNRFDRNSTFLNTLLGIDLQHLSVASWMIMPDGITANDACGDPDGGDDGSSTNTASNDLQNFPDLESADLLGSQIRIRGTFSSVLNRTYVLQFFATPPDESMGFDREGKHFLGELFLFHDMCSQPFEHTFTPEGPVAPGDKITVTATRFTDSGEWWSTSEYGGEQVFVQQLFPEGKVTGGGYIMPEAPICDDPCQPSSDTQANFGYIAQYKNKTEFDPQGHLNFVWKPGNVHLSSLDYTFGSLEVHREEGTGNGDARWRGSAKVNNKKGFCFEAFVQDMGEPGTLDTLHLRIWKQPDAATSAEACHADGDVVYDNNADTLLSGGNNQIHPPR